MVAFCVFLNSRSYDEKYRAAEVDRFVKETRTFLLQLKINKDVHLLRFRRCHFFAIGSMISMWFEKFPMVQQLMCICYFI
eukprot:snap_masked-scaffold_24-processed-gene-1.15-mRNA-1 protein AED:1.00 eAED:1.00 QI:0/0/0/0/1/1/2/0/79